MAPVPARHEPHDAPRAHSCAAESTPPASPERRAAESHLAYASPLQSRVASQTVVRPSNLRRTDLDQARPLKPSAISLQSYSSQPSGHSSPAANCASCSHSMSGSVSDACGTSPATLLPPELSWDDSGACINPTQTPTAPAAKLKPNGLNCCQNDGRA